MFAITKAAPMPGVLLVYGTELLFRILLWYHHCNGGKNGHNAKYLVAGVLMKSRHLWYLDTRVQVSRVPSPQLFS